MVEQADWLAIAHFLAEQHKLSGAACDFVLRLDCATGRLALFRFR